MDKENGKSSDNGSNSSKLSNQTDPAALLDAASLFGGMYFTISGALVSGFLYFVFI